jgi:hypothetical protein
MDNEQTYLVNFNEQSQPEPKNSQKTAKKNQKTAKKNQKPAKRTKTNQAI